MTSTIKGRKYGGASRRVNCWQDDGQHLWSPALTGPLSETDTSLCSLLFYWFKLFAPRGQKKEPEWKEKDLNEAWTFNSQSIKKKTPSNLNSQSNSQPTQRLQQLKTCTFSICFTCWNNYSAVQYNTVETITQLVSHVCQTDNKEESKVPFLYQAYRSESTMQRHCHEYKHWGMTNEHVAYWLLLKSDR